MVEEVEIAIVGGGLAGSAVAAVLSARGVAVALCDLHATYPADFRAEKLTAAQIRQLERLGFGDAVRRVATPIGQLSIARFGRVVERRPNREVGVDYANLVNAVRAQVPDAAIHIGRVAHVAADAAGARIVLADGRAIVARLAVVATGLGRGVVEALGISRVVIEDEHCLAIGFDIAVGPAARVRRALTYHGERLEDRCAYLTLFPIGDRLRANLFVYRRHDEGWARTFLAEPEDALRALMPGLASILGDFAVVARPVLRPITLYAAADPARDGVVLLGDAFATSCPTGGTGLDKVLTDVERLAALAPAWLAAGDTRSASIAGFYRDPAKLACDANARRMIDYARNMALNPDLPWAARRYRNFAVQAAREWARRGLGQRKPRS